MAEIKEGLRAEKGRECAGWQYFCSTGCEELRVESLWVHTLVEGCKSEDSAAMSLVASMLDAILKDQWRAHRGREGKPSGREAKMRFGTNGVPEHGMASFGKDSIG